MSPYLLWTLLALVVAALVLVAAGSATEGRGGFGAFVRDLRAGLRGRRNPAPEQLEAARVADVEPREVSIDEMLRAAEVDEEAYLQVDDLTDALHTVREQTFDKAVRGVQALARR